MESNLFVAFILIGQAFEHEAEVFISVFADKDTSIAIFDGLISDRDHVAEILDGDDVGMGDFFGFFSIQNVGDLFIELEQLVGVSVACRGLYEFVLVGVFSESES